MIGSTLITERLILRPLEKTDAPELLQYVLKNRDWLSPWEPSHPAPYFTEEGQRHILRQCLEERKLESGVLFGIFEKPTQTNLNSAKDIIGRISVSGIVRGIWQNGFIGYSIAKDRAGKGYMTEALMRVVDFSFKELTLHRIQASIVPRNKASLQVVKKCNFRFEGRALRYLRINDTWEDHEVFALTREDHNR